MLRGKLSITGRLRGRLWVPPVVEALTMQEKTVTPGAYDQEIIPDGPNACLTKVIVQKIPSNWGRITWDGEKLIVE